MKKYNITKLFLCLVLCLFISCSVEYKMIYDTYLEQSVIKELRFKDDKFAFNFIPVSNGIFFTIENLTDTTAFLIWDKSYFIEPDGNSYKAINLDLIKVEEEIARKEINESVLPKGTFFSRFTAPNVNVEVLKTYDITEINSYFRSNVSSEISVISNKFFDIGNYWTNTIRSPNRKTATGTSSLTEKEMAAELDKIRNFILENDNLGLGLAIKLDEKIYDYQFNFKLKEAKLYEVSGKNSKLIKTAFKANNWVWTDVE